MLRLLETMVWCCAPTERASHHARALQCPPATNTMRNPRRSLRLHSLLVLKPEQDICVRIRVNHLYNSSSDSRILTPALTTAMDAHNAATPPTLGNTNANAQPPRRASSASRTTSPPVDTHLGALDTDLGHMAGTLRRLNGQGSLNCQSFVQLINETSTTPATGLGLTQFCKELRNFLNVWLDIAAPFTWVLEASFHEPVGNLNDDMNGNPGNGGDL